MAELLFIATTIFVAYVVYEVVGKKEASKSVTTSVKPEASQAAIDKTEVVAASPALIEPIAKTGKAKSMAAKTVVSAPASSADNLKNPKTGEVAKLPSNYAFAKRWIKDALVEEGLLEKVYKNNELDLDTQAKIHEALQQLKAMPKYQ